MANHGDTYTSSEVLPALPEESNSRARALVTAAPPSTPGGMPGMPAPTYSGPEILNGGFSQMWLMNCLRRRWLMATLLGLLAAVAVGLPLALLFPESYKTVAYMEVQSKLAENPISSNSSKMSANDWELFAATTAALFKNPLVLKAALNDPKIKNLEAVKAQGDNAITWLTEELKVSYPNQSEILEIRYDGPESPEEMVKVVNAVCDAFRREITQTKIGERADEVKDLKTIHNRVKQELAEKTKEHKRLAEAAGAGDDAAAEIEIKLIMQSLSSLRSSISRIKQELVEIQIEKEVQLRMLNDPARVEEAVQVELDKDPTIEQYHQQIFGLKQMLSAKTGIGRNPNSPELTRIRGQIQQAETAMRQYRMDREKEIRKAVEDRPNTMARAIMTQYKLRMGAGLQRLKEMEAELTAKEDELALKTDRDPELATLRMEIERQQATESTLALKVQAADLMAENEKDQVKLIQPATPQTNINTIERFAIAGLGGLSALVLTCYGVALMDFRRRRLNGPTDLDEGLGIRVLGVLPSTTAGKALAGGSLVSAQVSEAVDNVRATLMHDSTSKKRQVVLVTSADTLDGCTTVAASLATSLARAGRRTLLVDGDLRSPSVHKLFGLPLDDGFCEVLRTEAELTDVIRPTSIESLYVLSAGVCDMDAVHALATDQPQPIFDKLREEFDFIVIDSAPVLSVSDSLSIGQYVDGAILSTLRDHSQLRKVSKATELLDELGIRLLGTVINGVPLKADQRVVRLHKAAKGRARISGPDSKANGKAAKPKSAAKVKPKAAVAPKPAEPVTPPKPVERPVIDESANGEVEFDDINIDDFDIDEL